MLTRGPSASFAPGFSVFPEMERVMSALAAPEHRTGPFQPPVNVWEDGHALYVESELPGYTLENLDIATLGNELTISGSRREQLPESATYLRRERAQGELEFKRTLKIGIPLDAERVQASLKHGVLTIVLPKAPAAKPRKIEVRPA